MPKTRTIYFAARLPGSDGADGTRNRAWDMLRYDGCIPAVEWCRFYEWVIVKKVVADSTERYLGAHGTFTLGRWESFGFRDFMVADNVPDLERRIESLQVGV